MKENFLNFVHGLKDYNSVANMQATNSPSITTIRKKQTAHCYHLSFEYESIVGVYTHERTVAQKLIFDIEIEFTGEKIRTKKDLDLSIKNCIINSSQNLHSKLLAHMAYCIGTHISDAIAAIKTLVITIKKPAALKNARCSYVSLMIK